MSEVSSASEKTFDRLTAGNLFRQDEESVLLVNLESNGRSLSFKKILYGIIAIQVITAFLFLEIGFHFQEDYFIILGLTEYLVISLGFLLLLAPSLILLYTLSFVSRNNPNKEEKIRKYAFAPTSKEINRTRLTEESLVDLKRKAFTDSLTGLMNRTAFNDIKERFPTAPAGVAVLMVDVDNFKVINDSHGHAIGDRVLEHIGHLIKNNISVSDTPIRMGGDEFCVILKWTSSQNPSLVAERIRREVAMKPCVVGGMTLFSRVSVGVSQVNSIERGLKGFDALLEQADHALYIAKYSGKDACATYEANEKQDA